MLVGGGEAGGGLACVGSRNDEEPCGWAVKSWVARPSAAMTLLYTAELSSPAMTLVRPTCQALP